MKENKKKKEKNEELEKGYNEFKKDYAKNEKSQEQETSKIRKLLKKCHLWFGK